MECWNKSDGSTLGTHEYHIFTNSEFFTAIREIRLGRVCRSLATYSKCNFLKFAVISSLAVGFTPADR